ncbi:MAG: pyruvate kinase [Bdellovibrionales bacterium]|nr:pyruvate kinase [Bdellovibrionales bacterium]
MLSERRVKIVATIGPSTNTRDGLEKAILAGMNVARLNFSHGSHDVHASVIENLRELAKKWSAPVSILQDLQGPKIRVGKFEGGSIQLEEGERVTVTNDEVMGKPGLIPTDFKALPTTVSEGQKILLDDGLIELKVLSRTPTTVECEVVYGGLLKDRKGMNVPGASLPIDALTEKDLRDLEFGLSKNVDYVALSFVRQGSDIKKLRDLVNSTNPGTKIVAKIEMLEALHNLEEIIELSDAVMVARGDLAIEVGQSQLPGIQKRIIRMCNAMNKPVITATQMLDSMVENPRPTRAEITDVANAVIDGSDALMLSAESASGKYPFRCIQTMHEIICEVEKTTDLYWNISLEEEFLEVPDAIATAASLTAMKAQAKALVCLTTTGKTATLIAGQRPRCPIIAITHQLDPLNRLELVWGIQTYKIRPYQSSEEALTQVEELLVKIGIVEKGDKVVVTMGTPVRQRAKTNSIRVYTVTQEPVEAPDSELPLRCRKDLHKLLKGIV